MMEKFPLVCLKASLIDQSNLLTSHATNLAVKPGNITMGVHMRPYSVPEWIRKKRVNAW